MGGKWERKWYEGAHPFGPGHNQSIEGINRSIKANQPPNFKPPKKTKRDVTEVLLAAGGRRRGEIGSRAGRRGRGRGTAPTSSSTCSPSSTKGGMSSGRGNRGRPRGSKGGRGRGAAPASRGSPSTTTCGMANDGGQGIGSTPTEL